MFSLLLLDFIDRKRTTTEELNARIQHFYYGPIFKKDKLKILTVNEIRYMAIPTKATQILTFFKLAPFILKGIIDTLSENYWSFKLMRRIIMVVFSKEFTKESLDDLNDDISDFLIDWKHTYYQEHGFLPNHHFLTHLVEDIRLFGHPSEFSCMRYEAKHQQFKRISKKKQGFKNHHLTLIKTFIGCENLKLSKGTYLEKDTKHPIITFKDNICASQNGDYYFISRCKNQKFDGFVAKLGQFCKELMCTEIFKTEISVTEIQCQENFEMYQILEYDEKLYILADNKFK